MFDSLRDANRDVYSVSTDGSDLTRLTTDAADDYAPAWSPDGQRIAFWSTRTGKPQIHVMSSDGSDVVQVTQNEFTEHSHHPIPPAWSPSGARLAFGSNIGDGRDFMHLWTIRVDGTGLRQITYSPGLDTAPEWSSDGRLLYFTRQDLSQEDPVFQIWSVKVGTFVEKQLSESDAYNWTPKLSPDGERLLFVRGDKKQTWRRLFMMNLDTGRVTEVRGTEGFAWAPAWSPKGTRIVYVDDPDGVTGARCFLDPNTCSVRAGPLPGELFTMRIDGTRRTQLTSSGAIDNSFPSYRP